MKYDDAERLSLLYLQLVAKLDDAAAFVQERDEDDWPDTRRRIGHAMSAIHDLAAQLWERFPNLKPVPLGGPYAVDPVIHEPRFHRRDEIPGIDG